MAGTGKIKSFTVHGESERPLSPGPGRAEPELTQTRCPVPHCELFASPWHTSGGADAQNVNGDGTDAMNKECDYSAAYVVLETDTGLQGHGMTFSECARRRRDRGLAPVPASGLRLGFGLGLR